jgi:6-phosphofructokinase
MSHGAACGKQRSMKRIGILTSGGDVPGIKAFVWRILDEPCEILGLRRSWASLLNVIPDR